METESLGPEEMEEDVEEDLNLYQLKVLPLCHDLHQKHGLRHNDYQRCAISQKLESRHHKF